MGGYSASQGQKLPSESMQLAWAIAASKTMDQEHHADPIPVDQTLHNWNSQPLCVANTSQLVYLTPYNTTECTYGTPQNQAQNQASTPKALGACGTPFAYVPAFACMPYMPTLMYVGGPASEQQVAALRGGKYSMVAATGAGAVTTKKSLHPDHRKKR